MVARNNLISLFPFFFSSNIVDFRNFYLSKHVEPMNTATRVIILLVVPFTKKK